MLPPLSPNRHGSTLAASSSAPALQREAKGSPEIGTSPNRGFLGRQLEHGSVQARRGLAAQKRDLVAAVKAREEGGTWGAAGAVVGFRRYLKSRFGSILAGWRELDSAGNGRLSFVEFCKACRRIGYAGKLKELWLELDGDRSNFISVWEIDPEVGFTVGTFKLQLLKRYGNMLTAWREGLDTNGSGRIDEEEVSACCQRLGLSLHSGKLFSMLRTRSSGAGGLTLKEFDPDAYVRWRTSDFQGLVSTGIGNETKDMPVEDPELQELQKEVPERPNSRAWRRELIRRDAEETQEAAKAQVRLRAGLHTVPGFKRALKQRCGSLYAAWRDCLDLDGSGKLTFCEFCKALRHLGFHGDVQGLWARLDAAGLGHIEFKDLDPETDRLLLDFREKMEAKHGNMLLAWMRAVDVTGQGCVREQEFAAACGRVGFAGDAARLFELLKPGPGRKTLSLADFDNQTWLAVLRGDYRMLTEAEEAARHDASLRKTEMSFLERSDASFTAQMTRARTAALREEFAQVCAGERLLQMRAADEEVEGFKQLCRRRFGSIVAAWRLCLDVEHKGKLSLPELCVACKNLGYMGRPKALWARHAKGNFLTLADLDARADAVMKAFFPVLLARYPDVNAAWKEGFKKDLLHGKVDEEGLAQLCRDIGCAQEAGELFTCIQAVHGLRTFNILDLCPLFLMFQGKGMVGVDPTTAVLNLERDKVLFATSKPVQTSEDAAPGPHETRLTRDLLRQALVNEFGSTVAAWRVFLDPGNRGFITFSQFCKVMQLCGPHGNLKDLWHSFAGDGTLLPFSKVDPATQCLIEQARRALLERYGTLLESWHKGADRAKVGRLDKADFAAFMAELGFPRADELFQCLLLRIGQRSITLGDYKGLLIGLSARERLEPWGGKEHMDRAPWAPPLEPPSLKEQAQEYRRALATHDLTVSTWEELRQLLIGKFGSLFAAWRLCLDRSNNGLVTQNEFSRACRSLGVEKVAPIWASLDLKGRGQLKLEELDAETAAAFKELEQLLLAAHGDTKEAWGRVFDPENLRRCDLRRFVASCQSLGYAGDPERLFVLLSPDPHRRYLTYTDLWTDHDHNEEHPVTTPRLR